jgi:acetyl-CoA carboxylase biotin carboxyl carrier protein
MDIHEIRELIGLFSESGLSRLDISDGDTKLVLEARSSGEARLPMPVPGAAQRPAAVDSGAEAPAPEPGVFVQTAPLVGTVYLSAAPGGDPLVKVGDTVAVGQPLCIVEAMKMYSSLTARAAGVVTEICVENGQAVGIGQALFKIAGTERAAS